MVCSTF